MSGIKFGQDNDEEIVLDLGDDEIEVTPELAEEPKVTPNEEEEKQKLNRNQRLKLQRDKERAARQELEQQLAQLKAQINNLKQREDEAKRLGTEHLLRTSETRKEQIKRELQAASDVGDSARIAELVLEATQIAADEKVARLQMPRQQPQQQQREEQQQAPTYDPKLQQWLQRNPWFQVDKERTNAAFAIHSRLVNDEYMDPTTDEYYEELDKALAKMNRSSANRAPTTHGERATSQPRKISVQLTPDEMATARRMNVSYEAYAKQKLLMEKNTDSRGYVLVDTGKGSK